MPSKTKSITDVKIMLKSVLSNLDILEDGLVNIQTQLDIKINIAKLLNKLESLPLEALKDETIKRKESRRRKKLYKKSITIKQNDKVDCPAIVTTRIESDSCNSSSNTQRCTPKEQKFHLRTLQEGHRFLQTFDLLEQLHLVRGKNIKETQKFGIKLQHLRRVWKSFCKEKENLLNTPEQKWNRVLFGLGEQSISNIKKSNLKEFLRRRTIWDSYIDAKYGTPIPIGWVLPDNSPSPDWSFYLCSSLD